MDTGAADIPSVERKFFVGSTLFVLGNFIPDDPNAPDFVQLNLGYRLTPRDAISLEAITWKYAWPLGIPNGLWFQDPDEQYPGYIREFGIALAYQRFLWRQVYTAVHAMGTLQRYVDDEGELIQRGFQLFMTYRLGYHFSLFGDRFFLEPSVAVTHWPVNTNVPEAFAALEKQWPNWYLFEPGMHFGVNF